MSPLVGFLWGSGGTLLGLLIGATVGDIRAAHRFRRLLAVLGPDAGPIGQIGPTKAEISAGVVLAAAERAKTEGVA